MEDDHNHAPQRKSISVLAKVKEKARKWKHTLSSSSSKKKNCDDSNTTPSWGVSLDDDDHDDPQHLGAPLYESEMAPQGYKQTSMKHPRVVAKVTPDISSDVQVNPSPKGNNNIKAVQASPIPKPNNIKNVQATPSPKANGCSPKKHLEHPEKSCPGSAPIQTSQGLSSPVEGVCPGPAPVQTSAKTISKTMAEKLGPAYTTVSDATYVLASKFQSLALSTQPAAETPKSAPAKVSLSPKEKPREVTAQGLPMIATKQAAHVEKSSPDSAPAAVEANSSFLSNAGAGKQLWDKGVSVKEYIMQKLEPGEDEKALSQVISKAISPQKNDEDATVVEKVREAVTTLLQNQQSSSQPNRSAYHSAQNSSSHIPPLTITDEVTEAETLERLLQTN